jgi:hypothetical protein
MQDHKSEHKTEKRELQLAPPILSEWRLSEKMFVKSKSGKSLPDSSASW